MSLNWRTWFLFWRRAVPIKGDPTKKMQKQHLPFCDLLESLYHHHPTCGISIRIYIFWSMKHFLVVTLYLLTVVCNLIYIIYLQVYAYIYIHCIIYTYTRTGLTLTIDVLTSGSVKMKASMRSREKTTNP